MFQGYEKISPVNQSVGVSTTMVLLTTTSNVTTVIVLQGLVEAVERALTNLLNALPVTEATS